MKQEYHTILNMRKKFFGIDRGFIFLDILLKFFRNKKPSNSYLEIDKLKIYDYRNNLEYLIDCNNQILFSELQQMYFDFMISNHYENNSVWYRNFKNQFFERLSKNLSYDANKILFQLFTRGLILAAKHGDYTFSKIEVFFKNQLQYYYSNKLSEIEINFFTSEIIQVFNKMNNLEKTHFKWVLQFTSLCLPPFYTETGFNVKYNSFFGFKKLEYIPNCAVATNNLIARDFLNYYYINDMNSYNLITNYYDLNIDFDTSKTVKLDIVEFFFRRNLILNDFLFQTVVTTCFETYYHAPVQNILFEKFDYAEIIDPEINFIV